MDAFITSLASIEAERSAAGRRYLEFLRVPDLSAGLYVLEAGAVDGQTPHGEDEVHVLLRGRSRFRLGGEEQDVRPGSVLFVPARVEHRFLDVQERLEALVFFGPAEGSRG